MSKPFILEIRWKKRGARQKKKINIQPEGYEILRRGRCIRLILKIVPEDRLIFTISQLKVYMVNRGTHPIHTVWKLQNIKYKMYINRIVFMTKLLEYNYICNIQCCIKS